MSPRKKIKHLGSVDPEYLAKQKKSLRRCFRKTVLFNSSELAMIDEYCSRFNVSSRSALVRKATMEHIMRELDTNSPTLF